MHQPETLTHDAVPEMAGALLAQLRARGPRVHCITNAVAQNFTANALLDSPMSGKFAGAEGLRQFGKVVAGLRKGRIGRHLITNVRVHGDSSRAQIKAYFIHISTPSREKGGERSTEVTNAGCYDCTAVKLDGRWWLERRTVSVDSK